MSGARILLGAATGAVVVGLCTGVAAAWHTSAQDVAAPPPPPPRASGAPAVASSSVTPEPTPAPPPVTTLPALPKPAPPKPATPPASTTSPPPSASSRPSTTKTTPPPLVGAPNARGLITFYAAADNDPPGSREIAYPGTVHQRAGGTGTFTDPLTFAAEAGQFAPGTKIYVPAVRRYFVLEDTCATCSGSHIDLWAGPATDQGVVACEESLTRDGAQPYQVDPPPGLPTAPGDLYTGGRCYPA